MSPTITFRPIDSADEAFLFDLFRSANEHKFVPLGLPEEQLTQLLEVQFQAQERQYRWQYENGDLNIVLAHGEPIGRYYVWRGDNEIVLVDITMAPDHRNQGIGGQLVRELLREGRREGKPVHAHVEKMNRAQQLWVRLGFQVVEDNGMYLRLEQPVEPAAATDQSREPVVVHSHGVVCD
jgi:GNAT superfamily N-acetyltransferase